MGRKGGDGLRARVRLDNNDGIDSLRAIWEKSGSLRLSCRNLSIYLSSEQSCCRTVLRTHDTRAGPAFRLRNDYIDEARHPVVVYISVGATYPEDSL